MYHQSSLKPIYQHMSLRPYERIDCWDPCIGRQNNMAAGRSSSTALSRPRANFLHQTCTAGLIKHLPPDTGGTSAWMASALSPSPAENEQQNAVAYGMLSMATCL